MKTVKIIFLAVSLMHASIGLAKSKQGYCKAGLGAVAQYSSTIDDLQSITSGLIKTADAAATTLKKAKRRFDAVDDSISQIKRSLSRYCKSAATKRPNFSGVLNASFRDLQRGNHYLLAARAADTGKLRARLASMSAFNKMKKVLF